jgi:hypothetical protein
MTKAKVASTQAKPKLTLVQQIRAAKASVSAADRAVTAACKAKDKAAKAHALAVDKLAKLENKQRATAAK